MPEGLDLYNIIFEVESDLDRMSDGAAAQNNTVKDQVSLLLLVMYTGSFDLWKYCLCQCFCKGGLNHIGSY